MHDFHLLAISPIDGRYYQNTTILQDIFSEYGFLKYRIKIEIHWLQQLSLIPEITQLSKFDAITINSLNDIWKNFSLCDAKFIKEIEKSTNHDIKSIEYFLKKKISENLSNHSSIISFIHFSCTSDDINNLAYATMIKKTLHKVIIPLWEEIILVIKNFSYKFRKLSILSRTHGQPATPSTLGKEMINFFYRLKRQLKQLKNMEILGKINGTTGNYNAHMIAYPNVQWDVISKNFVNSLGLTWNPCTTQIEPHDYISELFSCIIRFNTILVDLNRDIWGYISLNYFIQKTTYDEVGSSIMPHKINPIDFENSEGNLGLSNAIMNHMIHKLPISRWQRDLSDSTVLRNIGTAIGYSIISYNSLLKGLKKITVHSDNLQKDLQNKWQLLAEPIQTVMRKFGIVDSYEELKQLTRNKKVTMHHIHHYIEKLNIPTLEKEKLKKITPSNYIGDAMNIVKKFF